MGSMSISFWREEYPGLSDYKLVQRACKRESIEGAVIVRYKSSPGGEYTHFAPTSDPDETLRYFRSEYCHDTEILYVDPRVPPHKIPAGLRITNDAPEGSYVLELKQLQEEEARRRTEEERRAQIQSRRNSLGQCVMCGQRLNFFEKLFGKERHSTCDTFKDGAGG